MRWYDPLLYLLVVIVRILGSFFVMGQGAALLIIAPFGSLYDKTFIKMHENNTLIAKALKEELKR